MKRLLLIYLSCLSFVMNGQNLISNPSFETHNSCPTGLMQLEKATDWYEPYNDGSLPSCSSTDLFDYCSTSSNVVPNTAGFGGVIPRTGNACAGLSTYFELTQSPGVDKDYREYIENDLSSPLVAGQEYCVSVWVSLASTSSFATSSFGVKFSQSIIDISCASNPSLSLTTLGYAPDVLYSGSFINSVSTWTELTFSYTASGGEQYFIFGNFSEVGTSSIQSTGVAPNIVGGDAYYYIDDVSVTAGGCSSSTVCDPIIASVGSLCESDANVDLTANLSGGTWSGTGVIDVSTGEFSPSTAGPGVYNVVYTAPCGNSDNINITVLDDFECSSSGGGGNVDLPSMSIGIPNAFSPNNDSQNDVLKVLGVGIQSVKLKIYNRYGIQVFESLDQNYGWDGTFKGKMENAGVFVYTLEYEFVNGETGFLKGNVTLNK